MHLCTPYLDMSTSSFYENPRFVRRAAISIALQERGTNHEYHLFLTCTPYSGIIDAAWKWELMVGGASATYPGLWHGALGTRVGYGRYQAQDVEKPRTSIASE